MLKIATLLTAIVAWPIAATLVETIEKPFTKPVAFHITPELVPIKTSATNLQVNTQPDRLQFANKQGVVMNYDQLKAWDANGQPLEASFEKSKGDYCIHVQSKNAVYPITIDPLSALPAVLF